MNLIDTLDGMYGKATGGEWSTGSVCNGAMQLRRGESDQTLAMSPPDDAAWIAQSHNAWPAISRALRAAEDAVGCKVGDEDDALATLRKVLEGLVKP